MTLQSLLAPYFACEPAAVKNDMLFPIRVTACDAQQKDIHSP